MNTVRFELIELPYPTLARFGLTQEMIEDLPMRVLDEICDGRHSLENIKSLDPLLYSHLTHQKYIRIK